MFKCPNKSILEINKMTITKPYEQILTKTFYFASPIFVEALTAKWSPPEFLQNFRKWFKASIKFTKLLMDPFANKEENNRGVFQKMTIFKSYEQIGCKTF